MKGKHLISVDELRAAGALDVPPAWRKTLGVERDQFQGLLWEHDDPADEEEEPTSPDPDDEESEDDIP